MIQCPNRCSGGLVTKQLLWFKRKTSCNVCKGRGFIVDTSKFYAKMTESFQGWDISIQPKGECKYLVEVRSDERT